jgi:hypothetical protein
MNCTVSTKENGDVVASATIVKDGRIYTHAVKLKDMSNAERARAIECFEEWRDALNQRDA